jgi:hypothetical protein
VYLLSLNEIPPPLSRGSSSSHQYITAYEMDLIQVFSALYHAVTTATLVSSMSRIKEHFPIHRPTEKPQAADPQPSKNELRQKRPLRNITVKRVKTTASQKKHGRPQVAIRQSSGNELRQNRPLQNITVKRIKTTASQKKHGRPRVAIHQSSGNELRQNRPLQNITVKRIKNTVAEENSILRSVNTRRYGHVREDAKDERVCDELTSGEKALATASITRQYGHICEGAENEGIADDTSYGCKIPTHTPTTKVQRGFPPNSTSYGSSTSYSSSFSSILGQGPSLATDATHHRYVHQTGLGAFRIDSPKLQTNARGPNSNSRGAMSQLLGDEGNRWNPESRAFHDGIPPGHELAVDYTMERGLTLVRDPDHPRWQKRLGLADESEEYASKRAVPVSGAKIQFPRQYDNAWVEDPAELAAIGRIRKRPDIRDGHLKQ